MIGGSSNFGKISKHHSYYKSLIVLAIAINTACRGLLPLQQIWLDQNITQELAPAYEANIFYRIFAQTREQITVGKTSFSVFPAVWQQSFETFYVTFYIKF